MKPIGATAPENLGRTPHCMPMSAGWVPLIKGTSTSHNDQSSWPHASREVSL